MNLFLIWGPKTRPFFGPTFWSLLVFFNRGGSDIGPIFGSHFGPPHFTGFTLTERPPDSCSERIGFGCAFSHGTQTFVVNIDKVSAQGGRELKQRCVVIAARSHGGNVYFPVPLCERHRFSRRYSCKANDAEMPR